MGFFDNKDSRRSKEDLLHKKHGFTDPRANATIEATDRYLIQRIKEIGLHNIKNPAMRQHFERKIARHERFEAQESYAK